MDEYSNLSLEELKQLLYLNLQLDEEIIEEYLVPRWQFHQEHWFQIFQPNHHKQFSKEISLAFLLLVAEPYTRSQVKNILSTSLENKNIAAKLRPFHRDIQDLLELTSKEALNFSTPMAKIAVKEKEPYQKLLEELTQIIRQHSASADQLVFTQQPSFSPNNKAVEEVQEKIAEKELQVKKEKKILLTVRDDERQKILQALLPYVDPAQARNLEELFSTGSSPEPVFFTGNNKQLGDFFRRLKDKEALLGISYYTELAEWLSQYFFFQNKDKGGFTPVKSGSILKVLQDGDKPKTSIRF